jgi:hypothetical protein
MSTEKIEFLYPKAEMLPENLLPRRSSQEDYKWFTEMPAMRETCGGLKIPTIRICPAIADTMALGFVIPMPCDLEVVIGRNDKGMPTVKATFFNKQLISTVVSHHPLQFLEMPSVAEGGWFNVKINTNINVLSSGNVNMLYVKPFYHDSPLFEAISGTVDHALQHQLHFNLKWKAMEPGVYLIKAGTPMLQAIPIPKKRIADFRVRQLDRAEAVEIHGKFSKLFIRGDYRVRQKLFYSESKCPVSMLRRLFPKLLNLFKRPGKSL